MALRRVSNHCSSARKNFSVIPEKLRFFYVYVCSCIVKRNKCNWLVPCGIHKRRFYLLSRTIWLTCLEITFFSSCCPKISAQVELKCHNMSTFILRVAIHYIGMGNPLIKSTNLTNCCNLITDICSNDSIKNTTVIAWMYNFYCHQFLN